MCNLNLSGVQLGDSWPPTPLSLIQPEGKEGEGDRGKTDPKYSKLKRRTEISDFFNSIGQTTTSPSELECAPGAGQVELSDLTR
jgi:hypothetical protein